MNIMKFNRKLLVLSHKALIAIGVMLMVTVCGEPASKVDTTSKHPMLVTTANDLVEMRQAIKSKGLFQQAYLATKSDVDALIQQPIVVPVPKDGGGGYTHERHKKNYQFMYNASLMFQMTQEEKYLQYVKDMLLQYAELYPTLPLHPKRKMKSQNPGKFFWQSLNEAMWLVYTIQAYDLIVDALSVQDKTTIENKLLKPVALFLSEGQPSTFNKVHNHGTWATAGVGMAGYVLDEPEWVEKALYDLDKSGKGGFLAQLDELFSPQGYYNEGPYYQRFALLPFITFAKAIENNEPQRKIFQHRDSVLLKAIDTTIQLSYNKLFFPINDAIKSKGIDTIELVQGVTVLYSQTQDTGLLDIAQVQDQIVLSGDGLRVAQAIDNNLSTPYQFKSVAFGDGADGQQGALVVMRSELNPEQNPHGSALLFKPASQGLGHGHFDKLTWQFYDHGSEIVSDYGAARFLNVEAKYGGRYLPENETYAKHTVAHNTVVVNESSHFDKNLDVANANYPKVNFFEHNQFGSVSSAQIGTAYPEVLLERTLALVDLPKLNKSIAIDLFAVESSPPAQFDLPLHYHGQLIETNLTLDANTQTLSALGQNNGYQHLWLKASATPEKGLAKVTWLHDNGKFYTQTSSVAGQEAFLFTQIGANDPNFNLRNEQSFIRRVTDKTSHQFVSLLEPHGEYNPSKEYTLQATSQLSELSVEQQGVLTLVSFTLADQSYLVVVNKATNLQGTQEFKYQNQPYSLKGRLTLVELDK